MEKTAARRLELYSYDKLVLIILIIACGLRIYGLDNYSLGGDELYHVMSCSQGSWGAAMRDLFIRDANPPAYRTLLYQVIWWFGSADFVVRLPSAIAGVLTVYFTYVLGRKYISQTAGLMAAAGLAGMYQAITSSQEAQPFSLLSCCVTAHLCLFHTIFLEKPPTNHEPCRLLLMGNNCNLLFSWKPAIPVNAWTLIAFWAVGIAIIWLHYIGSAIIVTELLVLSAMAGIQRQAVPEHILAYIKSAYAPLLGACILWIPIFIDHLSWALRADLLFHSAADSLQKTLQITIGPDVVRKNYIYNAISISAGIFTIRLSFKKISTNEFAFLLIALLLATLSIAVYFSQEILPHIAYTYLLPIVCVAAAYGVSTLIEHLPLSLIRLSAVIALLFSLFAWQISKNDKLAIYKNLQKPDYRSAVELVLRDTEFLSSSGRIIYSPRFSHYIEYYGLDKQASDTVVSENSAADSDKVSKLYNTEVFYYLEELPGKPSPTQNALMQDLESRFNKLCTSRFSGVQISKFDASLPPTAVATSDSCETSTAEGQKLR